LLDLLDGYRRGRCQRNPELVAGGLALAGSVKDLQREEVGRIAVAGAAPVMLRYLPSVSPPTKPWGPQRTSAARPSLGAH
jgi:hypothetical protein